MKLFQQNSVNALWTYKRVIRSVYPYIVPVYVCGLTRPVILLDNWTAGVNIRLDVNCTDDRIFAILLYLGFS